MNNKALSTVPILESMVFITLAVKWAMACGVKDRKVYKYLKKYYYQHLVTKGQGPVIITNGWAYQRLRQCPLYYPFIGIRYIHFEWYENGPTNVVVCTNDTVCHYDNMEFHQYKHHYITHNPHSERTQGYTGKEIHGPLQ